MMEMSQLTLELQKACEGIKDIIAEDGIIFPTLHIYSLYRKLEIASDNPSMIHLSTNENLSSCPGDFWRTILAFKMTGPEDEMNIQKEADRVAREYNPDGIGYIVSCQYRSAQEIKENAPSTRILRIDAFTPDRVAPETMIVPYANYGKQSGDNEYGSNHYRVGFIDAPWLNGEITIKDMIKNPYRGS